MHLKMYIHKTGQSKFVMTNTRDSKAFVVSLSLYFKGVKHVTFE